MAVLQLILVFSLVCSFGVRNGKMNVPSDTGGSTLSMSELVFLDKENTGLYHRFVLISAFQESQQQGTKKIGVEEWIGGDKEFTAFMMLLYTASNTFVLISSSEEAELGFRTTTVVLIFSEEFFKAAKPVIDGGFCHSHALGLDYSTGCNLVVVSRTLSCSFGQSGACEKESECLEVLHKSWLHMLPSQMSMEEMAVMTSSASVLIVTLLVWSLLGWGLPIILLAVPLQSDDDGDEEENIHPNEAQEVEHVEVNNGQQQPVGEEQQVEQHQQEEAIVLYSYLRPLPETPNCRSLQQLRNGNIHTVSGLMQCRREECGFTTVLTVNIVSSLTGVAYMVKAIGANKALPVGKDMVARWVKPKECYCRGCKHKTLSPVVPYPQTLQLENNYFFLFLTQQLGFLTQAQLQLFLLGHGLVARGGKGKNHLDMNVLFLKLMHRQWESQPWAM